MKNISYKYVRNWQKASITIEMSFLMPIILMLIMACILGTFYFHDKNIVAGAAYETVVVGSTRIREKNKVTEAQLQRLYSERIGDKCILFPRSNASILIGEKEIQIKAYAQKGKFGISVLKSAAVTEPEKFIRNLKRIEGIVNGASGDD